MPDANRKMTFEYLGDFGKVVGASGFEPPTPRSRNALRRDSVDAHSSPLP